MTFIVAQGVLEFLVRLVVAQYPSNSQTNFFLYIGLALNKVIVIDTILNYLLIFVPVLIHGH